MYNPLEQFSIKEILVIDILYNKIILTDIVLYIIIGILIIIMIEKESKILLLSKKLIVKEIRKEIIEKIIRAMVSKKEKYIIIIYVLFIFILTFNIIGMVPYNKTITSELILTISLSMSLVIGITIIGIMKQGIKLLKILIPENTPIILVPLLITIETVSYLAKCISLGLRLGANMIAGHTLLKIIILFIYNYIININISESGIFFCIIKIIIIILPIGLLTLIITLEIGVGLIQAIVFVIITGIYINDIESKEEGSRHK